MAVNFNVKNLVYKELSPLAKAANCQLILLDSQTYKSYTDTLEKKMDVLGIDESHYRELIEQIEYWGCIAVLKSNVYDGPGVIAQHFSKVGLEKDEVHMLNSVNAKKYPVWGDFDASIPKKKAKFFYWFRVHIVGPDGMKLLEDDGRYSTFSPIEFHGIKSFLTVQDLLDAIDKASYQNGVLNATQQRGMSYSIIGQVNKVISEQSGNGTMCVLQLAPYKNGSRSIDCSVDGDDSPPLRFPAIKQMLKSSSFGKYTPVFVRHKKAYSISLDQPIVTSIVDKVDVDQKMGVFIRLGEELKVK